MTSLRPPQVYRAISLITADFAKAGIAKSHTNVIDQYQYRSIDDLLNRLGPLLARRRLCVLPRVLKRQAADRKGEFDRLLVSVRLLVAFDLVSAHDGSIHTVKCWGEALDVGDKGTAKAMSAAFKTAMLQTFCVPVTSDDPDGATHHLKIPYHEPEPVEGWPAWSDGIVDMIGVCESLDALNRVRLRRRKQLDAMKRERPEHYARIGEAFVQRSQQLAMPGARSDIPPDKTEPIETVDG